MKAIDVQLVYVLACFYYDQYSDMFFLSLIHFTIENMAVNPTIHVLWSYK